MAKSINISKFIKFVDVRKYDYYIVYKSINNSEAFFSFEEIPCQFVDNFIETIGIIYENKLIPAGLIRKKREEDITLLGLDINDAYYVNKNYLSANNIFMYRKRKNKYQQRFVEKINYIKNTLGEKDIDINTVVITNGSALEAYGIRLSGDTDLIVHPSIRNRISNSDGRIELGRDIEIKPENSYACLDQEMVDDSNNYVIVQGLKFMSLKICFRYNYSMRRKKHNRMDLLLIVRYVLNI